MTGFAHKSRIKLSTRLSLLSLGLGGACLAILLVIMVAAHNIKHLSAQITNDHLQEITANSRVTRDLSRIFADINLMGGNFYGQSDYLFTQGDRILKLIRASVSRTTLPTIKNDLLVLEKNMQEFLEACAEVNQFFARRTTIESSMDATLARLEDTITETMIGQSLDGEDTSFMEQLSLLVFGYRENLLRIENTAGKISTEHFTSIPLTPSHPLVLALEDFRRHLRTLTTAQQHIAIYGQRLSDHVDAYEHNVRHLHTSMQALQDRIRIINRTKAVLLEKMASIDARIAQSSQKIVQDIDTAVVRSLIALIAMFGFIILTLVYFTTRFVKSHVQSPLSTILQEIKRFQQGDFSGTLVMDRHDEWAAIQKALNTMAEELESSYWALRDSEQKYRDIVDNAPDGIFQMEMSGKLRNANDSMATIFGYAGQDELQKNAPEIFHQVYIDENRTTSLFDLLKLQPDQRHFETPLFTTNGFMVWVSVNARVVQLENTTYMEGNIANITERKHTEMDLERLRIYLDNIINSMPSILIAVDPQGMITQWNKQAESKLGIRSDLAKGTALARAVPVLAQVTGEIQQAIDRQKACEKHKVPLTLNKEPRFTDITIFPLITNSVEGAVIRIDDITDKMRIEEMMIQSEKMLSVGGLAAGMAHEINNPLAGILQAAQVIEMRLDPDLSKNVQVAIACGTTMESLHQYMEHRRIRKMLMSIRQGGERAARIVENMLSFSRKGNSEMAKQDITQLMDATIELAKNDYDLKKSYDFKNIVVHRQYDQDMPEVPCERSKIQQVFFNILKNGAHAMAAQKALGNPDYTPTFSISITQTPGTATVEIKDNGPGIEESVRKRIFEPFFTTKEVGTGTGLGLSVSYFIITDNHNGMMYVDSTPGEGARFVIKLPLEQEQIKLINQ
jgi:PAS domain S-box-containing protein